MKFELNTVFQWFWFDKLTVKLFDRSIPEWGIKIRENFDPYYKILNKKQCCLKKNCVYIGNHDSNRCIYTFTYNIHVLLNNPLSKKKKNTDDFVHTWWPQRLVQSSPPWHTSCHQWPPSGQSARRSCLPYFSLHRRSSPPYRRHPVPGPRSKNRATASM